LDATQKVASRARAHRLHALAPQSKHLAGLRFSRNLEHDRAIERRHFHLPAKRGGRDGDRHITEQVVAVALEQRMRPNLNIDIQIAGATTLRAGSTLTAQANAVAG